MIFISWFGDCLIDTQKKFYGIVSDSPIYQETVHVNDILRVTFHVPPTTPTDEDFTHHFPHSVYLTTYNHYLHLKHNCSITTKGSTTQRPKQPHDKCLSDELADRRRIQMEHRGNSYTIQIRSLTAPCISTVESPLYTQCPGANSLLAKISLQATIHVMFLQGHWNVTEL